MAKNKFLTTVYEKWLNFEKFLTVEGIQIYERDQSAN